MAYRTMWNEEMEAISPQDQRSMEAEKLARQLEYVYARSPFYERKFREAGLTPTDIRHVEDLSRLSFTTKAELRESQERERLTATFWPLRRSRSCGSIARQAPPAGSSTRR